MNNLFQMEYQQHKAMTILLETFIALLSYFEWNKLKQREKKNMK